MAKGYQKYTVFTEKRMCIWTDVVAESDAQAKRIAAGDERGEITHRTIGNLERHHLPKILEKCGLDAPLRSERRRG